MFPCIALGFYLAMHLATRAAENSREFLEYLTRSHESVQTLPGALPDEEMLLNQRRRGVQKTVSVPLMPL